PSGPRRFGGPVQAEPWDGVRDTLSHGPTAPQPHRQFTLVPEPVMDGEDYLNLNVYTPDPGGGGLPVLVWIHGGGFTAGCDAMAIQLGVPATRAGFAGVEPAAIVAAQDVVAAARPRGSGAIRLAFGPVADDELALSTPYEPVEAGTHAGVPLMLGATAEEFNATFANVEGGVDEARLERRLGGMGRDARAIADYRAAPAAAPPWF